MLKGKICVKEGYCDTHDGWISPIFDEVVIINVFWHPIDGPQVAVARDFGEIEFFPMNEVEVIDQ